MTVMDIWKATKMNILPPFKTTEIGNSGLHHTQRTPDSTLFEATIAVRYFLDQ